MAFWKFKNQIVRMHVNLYERISKTVWHVIQCQTEIRQTTTYNFLDIPSMKKKDDHQKMNFWHVATFFCVFVRVKTISLDVCFCKNREKDGYTQKGERNLSFMSIWGMTIEQNVICLLKSRKIMPLHTYAWAYVRPRYYMLQHCILRKNTLICSDQLPI